MEDVGLSVEKQVHMLHLNVHCKATKNECHIEFLLSLQDKKEGSPTYGILTLYSKSVNADPLHKPVQAVLLIAPPLVIGEGKGSLKKEKGLVTS